MLVLLLLGVLFAYQLQKYIYGNYWDKNLQVRTSFSDAYVYEGDTSSLREEISNDKKLPLPALEVRLAVSRNLEFSGEAKANTDVTDLSYKRDVFSFLFHQKVIHTLPFICRKRGFYQISKVEVVGYDLFFHTKKYLSAAQQTQLYVYPAQIDVNRIRLICQAISGMVLVQNRLYPDPFEFSGIREYQRDPMHHINWKASARSSSLMVNQFDSTTSIQTTILLDVEDSRILRSEALTEEGIRIASSLAARLVRQNMELRLASNATTGKFISDSPDAGNTDNFANDPSAVSAGRPLGWQGRQYGPLGWQSRLLTWQGKPGAAKIHELNRLLACIDIGEKTAPINDLLREEVGRKQSGQIYVLISKNQDIVEREFLRALSVGNEILWIVPVAPGENLLHEGAPGIHFMRWEVGIS